MFEASVPVGRFSPPMFCTVLVTVLLTRSVALRIALTPRCIRSLPCSTVSRAESARSLAVSVRRLRVSSPLIGANKTPKPTPTPRPIRNDFIHTSFDVLKLPRSRRLSLTSSNGPQTEFPLRYDRCAGVFKVCRQLLVQFRIAECCGWFRHSRTSPFNIAPCSLLCSSRTIGSSPPPQDVFTSFPQCSACFALGCCSQSNLELLLPVALSKGRPFSL